MLHWNEGDRNWTCLLDWLDETDTNAAIAALEASAGAKGDWDAGGDDYMPTWGGLMGTYKGVLFTVYTHKSGRIHIGGHPDSGLDLGGLKTELRRLL